MTKAISSTIRIGRVELDSPTDWPDGQRVSILPHLHEEPVATELPEIELPDGRVVPVNGSLEHCKLLAEQMGRPNLIDWTIEEEAAFDKALEDMNRLYGDPLKKRADE